MTLVLYQGTPLDFFEQPVEDEHRRGCRNGSFAPAARDLALEHGRVPTRGTLGVYLGGIPESVHRADWEWNDCSLKSENRSATNIATVLQ